MAVFEIGDWVEALDDDFRGRVTAVHGQVVQVMDTDGFVMELPTGDLVKIPADGAFRVTHHEAALAKKGKEAFCKKKPNVPKRKKRNAPKMEVDLHIHQLVPSTKGLTNHDMLNLQLEAAKRQLEFAMRKRIQKVVFIHGVGEGVLKEELHYLFRRYDNLHYYEADYQQYGLGATEVYIFQNP